MTDEQSPESVVAGEAAAAAVEELKSREATEETAVAAVITASEAQLTAEDAGFAASAAAETAVIAAENASEAQGAAASAQEAAYLTAEALQAHCDDTDAKLREMREYIDSRIPLSTPTAPDDAVEEIEVNDGTARIQDSGVGDGSDSAEKSADQGESPREEKYGLRARRRRRN
jgi:hypothetical protein